MSPLSNTLTGSQIGALVHDGEDYLSDLVVGDGDDEMDSDEELSPIRFSLFSQFHAWFTIACMFLFKECQAMWSLQAWLSLEICTAVLHFCAILIFILNT